MINRRIAEKYFFYFLLIIPILSKAQSIHPQSAVDSMLSRMDRTQNMAGVPYVEMVSPDIFRIDDIWIMGNSLTVEFPAIVNMQKGLLEYLIVGENGKLHESLLRTKVSPFHLQIALLTVGLKGTTHPLSGQGDIRQPEGDPVYIWIRWTKDELTEKVPIGHWVKNIENSSWMGRGQWVFTGSAIVNGLFLAQADQSIAALFHDPAALFDNPNPGGGNDEIWYVHEEKVPPVGTAVTVIVEKM